MTTEIIKGDIIQQHVDILATSSLCLIPWTDTECDSGSYRLL